MADTQVNVQPQSSEPEAEPKQAKQSKKPEPVKPQKIRLVLTGASSYNDLNSKLGVFKKGVEFEIDSDNADRLLKTGLFKKI